MIRRPPRSTRTDTLFPYTTLFRSFDMGGTSTDVSWYAGSYERREEAEVAGVRLRTPMLAIHTVAAGGGSICTRSEEHTSELQSLMRISYAVFCLKKKNTTTLYKQNQRHQQTSIKHKTHNNKR